MADLQSGSGDSFSSRIRRIKSLVKIMYESQQELFEDVHATLSGCTTLLEAYMTRKMALESALSNVGTEDQDLVQEFFKLFEDVHATLSGCIKRIQNQCRPELTSGVVKLVAEHGHLLKEVKKEREENAPAPLENGEAEVIILGPEAISVTPDPCHEVVVLTSDEPSSSGICTQSTQQKSKAELLEELRQEKEAREKLEASMKRIIECLDLELSCSICSEVFVKPVKLPCLHTFCQTCILQWERNQRDCPMCRAKYTTVGRADSLLVCCIEKLIESTYTQDEKHKRAELVAARVELEEQFLPSTSDSGQTRGSRGRNSGQRGRGIPAIQPAHIRVGTMPTTIVQPASPHQVLRLTRMPGQHSGAVATNGRVITVRTTRGGQRPPWRF